MNEWQRASRKNKSYKLVPYNPAWAEEFLKLRSQIAPLYGDNLIGFEHIGSTAVPGMLAKAQIDVCVIVTDIENVTEIRPKFEALGYQAKGDYVGQQEEYFTFEDENGERKYNIHTLQAGNPAIEGYLSFRDYLRSNKKAMNQYIAVKEELRAAHGENDYNSYDWNKGDKIKDLKQEALHWYRKAT
jgi:GrpB-like predicted nucleotidyltransferase (UPF0157 family)